MCLDQILSLIQTLVSIIGLPVLVCSLALLLKQTKEMTKQSELAARATRAGVYQNIPALMIEIDRFFVEKTELKPYFYNKAEIREEHPDYERVLSVAEMLLDFMDYVTTLAPNMPEYPWDTWERYFKDLFASSPVLQGYWAEHREWYPDVLQGLLDFEV